MKKNIILFIIMIYCFNGLISRVKANSVGLSISPPVTEVLIAPNKTTTTTITIKNLGEVATLYQVSLHKAIPTDDQGHSTIDPTPLNLHQLPLIPQLIGHEFDTPYPLESGQSTNLTLKLDAPSLDIPTDLYLALVVRALDPITSNTTSASTPAIASLILATITPIPAIPTDISLKDLDLPLIHDSYHPLKFSPKAVNQANVMLRIQGTATLTSTSGHTVHQTKLDPTLILGGSSRVLSTLQYNLSPLDLGPHQLTIKLTTEGGRSLLELSRVIWILPLRAMILIFIGSIILLTLIIRHNRLTVKAKKD